jgi:multiple sugar transport system ATP-binding protein
VKIGFRPEHLDVANGQADGGMRIPVKVDVVEYLGNEELIHAQADGNDIVALVAADRKVQVGDAIDFTVPMEKLHIFDPASEARLSA